MVRVAGIFLTAYLVAALAAQAFAEASPSEPATPPALFLVKVDGKWGYIDRAGKVVIKPQFDSASPFSHGLACVDIGGAWVTERTQDRTSTSFQGGKWGYIDPAGRMTIEATFERAESFAEGLAAISFGLKWGYISKTGKIMIEPQFAQARAFCNGLARVSHTPDSLETGDARPKYGYIDRTGRMVVPERFYCAYDFSGGFAAVVANDPVNEHWKANWGFIDRQGNFAVEAKFDWVLSFSEGLAAVYTRDKRILYLDGTGRTVFTASGEDGKPLVAESMGIPWRGHQEEAMRFREGLAPFRVGARLIHVNTVNLGGHGFYYIDGKWGYINLMGKVAIRPQFDAAHAFSEGLAPVAIHDVKSVQRYGYIDRTGKVVIEPRFDSANGFRDGLALVGVGDNVKDRKIGYIDKTGKYVWEPRN
jgi:hypothetical protein